MESDAGFSPLKDALKAARANVVPGLVLQAFALAIVLGYYFVPPVTAFCAGVAELKRTYGFLFSLATTAVFGGLIPFIWLRAYPATRAATPWIYLPFYLLFWAYRGVEVDALYRLQALMFGDGNGALAIVPKVAFDQFVYNPLWAAPLQFATAAWMQSRYDFGAFRILGTREFWTRKVPALLVSTWLVWIPMVAIIYSLPGELQVPLFNIVLCFWVLMLSAVTSRKKA